MKQKHVDRYMKNAKQQREVMLSLKPVRTMDEVAAELGMSRERVRQIEHRALGKLRKLIAERGLTFEDFVCGLI